MYGQMIPDPPYPGWVIHTYTGTTVFATMPEAEAAMSTVLDNMIAEERLYTEQYQVAEMKVVQLPDGFGVQVLYWAPAEKEKSRTWMWVVGGILGAAALGGLGWAIYKSKG